MFELYLSLLAADGRDAPRLTTERLVALAQPLRPERIFDRLIVSPSPEQLPLTLDDQKTGAPLRLTVRVESETPPPYKATFDVAWSRPQDLRVVWNGRDLQPGPFPFTLESTETELNLRMFPLRTPEGGSDKVNVVVKGSFGQSEQTTAQVTCVLPGPDQIELVVARRDGAMAGAAPTQTLEGGDHGGRLLLFPNRSGSYQLLLRNLSGESKELHAKLYRIPPWGATNGGRLFQPRSGRELLPRAADLETRIKAATADTLLQLQDYVIAQSDEKTPLALAAGASQPVVVPLVAAAKPSPPPAAAAPPPASPSMGADCSDGLLLVLTRAGGKTGEPYVKWIEFRPDLPDNLLEIRQPAYRDGRLSFVVELKSQRFVAEMGLAQQPMKVRWDRRSLPGGQADPMEADITAEKPSAEFSTALSPQAPWPLVVHLQVDGYPRALLAMLQRDPSGQVKVVNLKKDRLPLVHIGELSYAKTVFLIQSRQPRLPIPAVVQPAEGVRLIPLERERDQVIALPIGEQIVSVQFAVDLLAEVAPRYFESAAELRLLVDKQEVRSFASDRQVKVQLTGFEGGTLKLDNVVTDFLDVLLPPTSVELGRDRRIEMLVDVGGDNVELDPEAGTHRLDIILDRNAPVARGVEALPSIVTQSDSRIYLKCRAEDGRDGSGVRDVAFFVGQDTSGNGKLDENERGNPVIAREVPATDGTSYVADFQPVAPLKNGRYLVEAAASDMVGHVSAIERTIFEVRIAGPAVDRPSFGKEAKDEPRPGRRP
jgi:hypothetical protein